MAERIWKCPNCGAVLAPGRFARSTVCQFCRSTVQIDVAAVSAQRFRDAYGQWSAPRAGDARSWFALGDDHWAPLALLAHGEIADVYLAERARPPTERALLKVLRDAADLPMLDLEWSALKVLEASSAPGAAVLASRVPNPIGRGLIAGGTHSGAQALLHRWVPGFDHTFEAVRGAYPRGVDPHVAVWMWRRILEVLGFLHSSGIVHAAVLPQHLLVERGEHGVRLVGYGCADRRGGPLAAVVARYERFYPRELLDLQALEPVHDLAMSARCIAFVLGADDSGRIAPHVPAPLRALLDSVGGGHYADDARSLHIHLGELARELFGPPSFHPLEMPGSRAIPQPR